ncbi:hypothetical protein NDU88_004173 [Pleurodeles waltl]|uniref:Uncharacterized protein n=1 Tax=Pleurodeles waltl TaxID=8319 RepID=A0AAV7TQJ6_PLEWA|nr:hypothetical protein NDU88_004173 [Pleurodeles waltl]
MQASSIAAQANDHNTAVARSSSAAANQAPWVSTAGPNPGQGTRSQPAERALTLHTHKKRGEEGTETLAGPKQQLAPKERPGTEDTSQPGRPHAQKGPTPPQEPVALPRMEAAQCCTNVRGG